MSRRRAAILSHHCAGHTRACVGSPLGGNATGFNYFGSALGPKRLGLLHEFSPHAGLIAVLLNPNSPVAASTSAELRAAAAAVGRTIEIFHASNSDEINRAFAEMVQRKAGGFLLVADSLFTSRMIQIVRRCATASRRYFRDGIGRRSAA